VLNGLHIRSFLDGISNEFCNFDQEFDSEFGDMCWVAALKCNVDDFFESVASLCDVII
jgi:hypothetical protein